MLHFPRKPAANHALPSLAQEARRAVRTALYCLAIATGSACTLSSARPEAFGPIDEPVAGSSAMSSDKPKLEDEPEPSADTSNSTTALAGASAVGAPDAAAPAAPADAGGITNAAASGSAGAAGGAGRANAGGAAAPSGGMAMSRGGNAAPPPTAAADAGAAQTPIPFPTPTPTPTAPPVSTAPAPVPLPADPQQAAEDTACAFEFAACLLANPLNYAECAVMNADHCDLLAGSGTSAIAPDGGTQPSAACGLQAADCITRNVARAAECIEMLETCTL